MYDLYQERVLDSPAVCSNCYATVRVERVDPVRTGVAREYESHYERERRQTTVEYAPAESASQSKGVFCTCGVESAFHRVWTDRRIDRGRFRSFLKAVLRSVERQGITIDRRRAATHALQAFDERLAADVHGPLHPEAPTIDECLATGVAYGHVPSTDKSSTPPAKA